MMKGGTSGGASIALGLCLCSGPPAPAADCNRNGVEDWLEVTSGSQADCNGNDIPDPCDILPVNYGLRARGSLNLGFEPRSVPVTDLDGDGAPDIVALGEGSLMVRVFWNGGDGSFDAPESIPIEGLGIEIAAGDLDGDLRQDLLVTTVAGISFLINRGERRFSATILERTAADVPILEPVLADLDGDGDADLVSLGPFQVLIFRNRGDGVFTTPDAVIPVGSNPVMLIAARLDDDTDIDLVTANHLDSHIDNVSVLLNRGGGEFEAPRNFGVGPGPSSIAAGDLDGDGHADLATACATDRTIRLLLGAGDGTFRQEAPIQTLEFPFVGPIADLDGDGDLDLTVSGLGPHGLGVVLAFLNHGDARFAKPIEFPTHSRAGPSFIDDLTGDGSPEIAVPVPRSESILVLERAAIAHDADCNATGIPDGCEIGGNDCNLNGFPDCGDIASGESDDCDRNGIPDECESDCNESGTNDACELASGTSRDCNANGVPDECDIGPTRVQVHARSLRLDGSPFDGLEAADLDRDGHLDLIGVSSSIRAAVLWNDGQGGFDAPADVPGVGRASGIAAGDLDGDEDLDLVASDLDGQIVVLAQEARSFAVAAAINVSAPSEIALVDVDGDGALDLFTSGVFFTSEGNWRFQFLPDVSMSISSRFLFADMDGDGRVDLVAPRPQTGFLGIFWNSGGRFTEPTDIWPTPAHFTVADMDADDDLDLVTADFGGFSVLLQESPREFRPTAVSANVPLAFGFRALDLDRDGDGDLVTPLSPDDGTGFAVFQNEGGAAFREPALFPFEVSLGPLAPGDYDGDGRVDLAAPAQPFCILDCSRDPLVVFLLNRTRSARSADADRDGRPDECGRGSFRRGDSGGDGAVDLADAVFTLRALFQGGAAPGCAEAADADNDGKVDVTDPVLILEFLFRGGPPPASPGPGSCGLDPDPAGAPGDLGCGSYVSC